MTIQNDFDTFVDGISGAITDNVLNSDLPLIGNDLNSVAGTALQFIADLKSHVDSVFSSLSPGSVAQDIVTAFATANIPGVTAVLDPSDSTKVSVTISEIPEPIHIALSSGNLDFGGTGLGLDATAAFDAIIKPELHLSLSLDPAAETVTFVDSGPAEVKLGVGVAVDVSDGSGGPAEAELGPIDVKLTDNTPTTTPEIDLNFSLDLHSLDPTDFTAHAGGAINLDLGLETNVLNGVLPKIFADLVVKYEFSDAGAGAPEIQFNNVSIELGSLLNDLLNTIQPILDIFNAYPFKEIIHTLTDPLPLIGHLGGVFSFLDPVPGGGDGVINFLDLAAAVDPGDRDTISKFAAALPIIEQLAHLNASAASGEKIQLGDLIAGGSSSSAALPDGVSALDASPGGFSFLNAPTSPLDQLTGFLGDTAGIVSDALDAIKNVTNELNPNPLQDSFAAAGGLTFPLFEDPSKIVNILMPSLGDGKDVQFINYTMPELSYKAHMDEFFPVIGPFGLSLSGDFVAELQLSIGYDSHGLTLPSPNLIDGIYLSTPLVDPLHPMPPSLTKDPLVSPNGYLPVGYVAAGIHGGVGVGLVVAEAVVEGGFTGDVETYFPDGALRWTDIAEGCFFSPINGELTADVALRITIGFGIFSWTHRIVFAEATLADFSAECGGGIGVEDPGYALATPNPDAINGPDLLLNVGNRAGFRSIGGVVGTDGDEAFAIANATMPIDDVFATPQPLPGVLAVNAFGITENYGSVDNQMSTITANFGNGNDSLTVGLDVTQTLMIHGNAGDDRLYAGAGDATLYGDDGNDTLVGGTGNDHLYGGANDDYLEGGKGADYIDGGDGYDQVTYENSAFGVIFTRTTINGQSAFLGSGPAGSDAVGDTLINIEYIIGSHFDDVLYANPNQGSTLEALEGNDALIGGNGNDFLLGGPGADYMFGGAGEDGTSYLTSWGPVQVDLLFHSAHGGDAEGDVLIAMEDVQGTNYYDVLYGDNSSNVLDGWNGDDIIDGRGGPDVLDGGAGNDIVYGGADGDILYGGDGVDLLSYEHVSTGVTVNLHNFAGANGDRIGVIDSNRSYLTPQIAGYSTFENLTGTGASDNLTGDLDYNTIRGLSGNDIIHGDGGNDILIGGAGADQLFGDGGIDWASYEDSPGGVYANLQAAIGFYNDAQGDTFNTIENLRGSLWADYLVGDGGNNVIDPYLSTLGIAAIPGAVTDPAYGTPIDYVDGGAGYDKLQINYTLDDFGQALIGGYDYGSTDSGLLRRLDAGGSQVLDGVQFTHIEALSVIGTIHDDEIFAGSGNDFVATGGGNDLIYAGIGSDVILAQEDDDSVFYGTDEYQALSSNGGLNSDLATQAVFYLDGGRGIDSLSISLAALSDDITLIGHSPFSEFHGTNLVLPNGSAVVNFEFLNDVMTGYGDDYVEQLGDVDNHISTGWGEDIIVPGLGVDHVDGGGDFVAGREVEWEPIFTGSFFGNGPVETVPVLTDRAAFNANAGDLLVLDYSSFSGPGGIIGQVSSHDSQYQVYQNTGNGLFVLPVTTNQGSYSGGSRGDDNHTSVSFDEIERLVVNGSSQDDLIVGTFGVATFSAAYSVGTLRGADILYGGDGADLIIGNGGDDVLLGNDGNDILIGTDPTMPTLTNFYNDGGIHFYASSATSNPDQVEIDTLTGGAGADTFVLGNAQGYFYGNIENFYGSFFGNYPENHAVITDFNPNDGDVLQLNGNSLKYSFVTQDGPGGNTETLLYSNFGSTPDLIAEIYNFSLTDLNASYIHYVGGPNGDGVEVAAEQRIIDEASGGNVDTFFASNFSSFPALNAPQSWVTQDNNPTDLLDHLFGGSPPAGIVTQSVDLVGDGRAFGYFENDPFGVGSGIVLSTGQVADLPGQNTEDGGASPPQVIHLTFTAIGTFNGSTIYRADLSNLDIDINSFTLQDSDSHVGGSPGEYSGFDVDAIALSHTLVDGDGTNPVAVDMNSIGALNVFDFSAASMVFSPGTQRSGGFEGPDMHDTINGLIDNSRATLGEFDSSGFTGTDGMASLGDGGSLALNLTQAVSTSGPLYLYVGEAGISSETISGDISLSTGRIDAPNDLSTDFGAPGAANDDISFTYNFLVTDPNIHEIAFQFALFSEELAEFAGSEFNDTFKIMLNGVNLAHLSDGAAATVNNLMASPHVQLSDDLILNPAGSSLDSKVDAYTKLLDYAGAVNFGANTLTIEVADVRDGLMDSGILVKAGTFSGDSGSGLGGNLDGGSITFDDGSIASGTPAEVFEGGSPILIPVTIDPGLLGDLTAPVTIDFSADTQLDFGNGAGVPFSHTFNPGDGTFVFNLEVSAPDDHITEGPRFDVISLDVHSADPNFDGMAVAPIVVEIDDPQSHLSINDVEHTEGDFGTTMFEFTVTRTGGSAPLTVDFSTADDSATIANSDYSATSGTLSFGAGEMTKTIDVSVNGDIFAESNETFAVNLNNANGAVIDDGHGVGTIDNDDSSNGDTSGSSANTVVSLQASGGIVSDPVHGKVTLTGVINHFATGAGNDTIVGNNNGDILDSGAGNDSIRGGTGNDIIIGGAGVDRLTGGTGDDTFVFHPGFGQDTITDFAPGNAANHDTLDLRGLGFTSVADVLSHTDTGPNAIIHVGSDTITLQAVSKSLLASGHDFDFLV